MAKQPSSMLELARRGAQQRYEELQTEITALVRQFPNLRTATRGIVGRGRRVIAAVSDAVRPRRRRKMSAAGRARIAAAQRARWAKQKALASRSTTESKSKRKRRTAGKKR